MIKKTYIFILLSNIIFLKISFATTLDFSEKTDFELLKHFRDVSITKSFVGVVVAQLNKYKFLTSAKTIPENVNFAIKSQNVELFLDANQIAYSSKNSTYQVENRQIAQSAEKATVNLSCYNSIANLKEKYGEQKVSNIFSSENLPD